MLGIGKQVWLPLKKGWWPALIIDPVEQGVTDIKDNQFCVYCFGNHKMTVISKELLIPYNPSNSEKTSLHPQFESAKQQADLLWSKSAPPELETETQGSKGEVSPNDDSELTLEDTEKLLSSFDGQKKRSPQKAKKKKQRSIEKKYVDSMSKVSQRRDSDDSSGSSDDEKPLSSSSKAFSAQFLSKQATLKEIKLKIEALPTVAEMRNLLLQLSEIQMNFELLKASRIGVAVGNLLNEERYQQLNDFSKCLVFHWASLVPQHLIRPQESIEVLENRRLMCFLSHCFKGLRVFFEKDV